MFNSLAARWATDGAARRFRREGYVVFRGLLDSAMLRRIESDLEHGWKGAESGLLASIPSDASNVPATPELRDHPGARLLDPHWRLPAVREALLHPRLVACLDRVHGAMPMLFQSQQFATSPGAVWHRDDAYLALAPNRTLAAAWVALEPVRPGQGELEFVPGSQRLPGYAFGGCREWYTPPLDDNAEHGRYVAFLKEACRRERLAPRPFHAEAGDLILWDGRLVHGSVATASPPPRRRSLVAHYCAATVTPRYLHEGAGALAAEAQAGARYASGYYPD